MRFHISRNTKRRLANRFGYSVFLRLLLFKVWFRVAVVGFVLLLVFLALFLPKMWTATPRGFRPAVKISGLDVVQAWSLKRTARAEMAAGNSERAHYAWLAAAANNPTDAAAVRGLIDNLTHWPSSPPKALEVGGYYSAWLLRLHGTNRADVALVAQFYDAHEYLDPVVKLLWPRTDLQAAEETLLLKALFHCGRTDEFDARWKQAGADRFADAELLLYRDAFNVVWGTVDKAEASRERLKQACTDPAQRVLANRLQCFVCARVNDVTPYAEALGHLQDLGEDQVVDHTRYWRLLYRTDRKEQAVQLASSYSGQVRTVDDYIALGEIYDQLNLHQQAKNCFHKLIDAHPESDRSWLAYAAFLSEHQAWEDLARLAVQIRTAAPLEQRLLGFSYYLEGWAERELHRDPRAEEAFQKMPQVWVGYASLVLEACRNLTRLGAAQHAGELLARFEDELKAQAIFWELQFSVANELKDPVLLLKAAQNEFKLQPENPETENRYAAALLINRKQPDLAARLTLKLMTTYPNSVAARVNHGFALVLNHRPEEAWALLSPIQGHTATAEQASSLSLALFQVHYELREYQKAWGMLDHINSKLLFPTDAAWLEECRKKMPPRAAEN
jgi:tetratricopeptide (TPR) repeat protein